MKMKQLILCPMFFLCFDAQFLLRKNVMELWRDVHRTIRGVDDKDYVEFLTIQVCAHYCHCIRRKERPPKYYLQGPLKPFSCNAFPSTSNNP